MSSLARIIEKTVLLEEVSTTESTESFDLNGADKFSIQVQATVGDSISHLESSNDGETWTEEDDASIAEGDGYMFEVPNVSYRYVRLTLEKDDSVDVSASISILVEGDAI